LSDETVLLFQKADIKAPSKLHSLTTGGFTGKTGVLSRVHSADTSWSVTFYPMEPSPVPLMVVMNPPPMKRVRNNLVAAEVYR
jgi:hypothetical protein